jgi:hypothetical protein
MFDAFRPISTPDSSDDATGRHLDAALPHKIGSPRHTSPSLRQAGADGRRAYELKFLLSHQQAATIEDRLAAQLTVDPHADPASGGGYRVATLYCDTPQWHVFHRQGRFKLFKLRLRKYGVDGLVYLERKARRKDFVRKLRSSIEIDLLSAFAAEVFPTNGYGGWYHRQLRRNQLQPVCLVEYQRTAYFSHGDEGPIRLTFDRHIRGGLVDAWSFEPPARMERVLTDQVVCEFKFRGTVPTVFKSVIEAMQLIPGRVSKYRLCVEALGATGNGSAADG